MALELLEGLKNNTNFMNGLGELTIDSPLLLGFDDEVDGFDEDELSGRKKPIRGGGGNACKTPEDKNKKVATQLVGVVKNWLQLNPEASRDKKKFVSNLSTIMMDKRVSSQQKQEILDVLSGKSDKKLYEKPILKRVEVTTSGQEIFKTNDPESRGVNSIVDGKIQKSQGFFFATTMLLSYSNHASDVIANFEALVYDPWLKRSSLDCKIGKHEIFKELPILGNFIAPLNISGYDRSTEYGLYELVNPFIILPDDFIDMKIYTQNNESVPTSPKQGIQLIINGISLL
jgi:hypothetical protein